MSSSAPPESAIATAIAPTAETTLRYRVRHSSAYRYGSDIMLAHHLLHLTPRQALGQRVMGFRMDVEPKPSVMTQHQDYFGNPTTYLELHEPHTRLSVKTDIDIEVDKERPDGAIRDTPWEMLRDQLTATAEDGSRAASVFAYASTMVGVSTDLRDFALPSFPPGRPIGEAALDLTTRIYEEFTFDPEATTIATPVAEVLENKRGVCQDFAHLEIACLRSLGLGARYVSGYLRTIPAPGKARAVGSDVSHAWLSVWCGGDAWLDMDPTNGRAGSSDLITLAWGRDYGDVSPLQGVIIGSSIQHLTVEVDVE
ncbi:MAG: transglutaminase [Rhodospirillales bacterium]|nr:transglutaminase [Rhodospirillales bacterium]